MAAGYDGCCIDGFCAGTPPNCFCDYFCTFFGDCCSDLDQICTEREYIGIHADISLSTLRSGERCLTYMGRLLNTYRAHLKVLLYHLVI